MANLNAPSGFEAICSLDGTSVESTNTYEAAVGNSNAFFIGDALKLLTDSDSTTGVPLVDVCATGSRPVGVMASVRPILSNLTLNYKPASTLAVVNVCDDPNTVFEIQSDGTAAHADVGEYTNITVSTAGSTVTGRSGMQLHESSVTSTATSSLPLMILRLSPKPNNAFGANAIMQVLLITHIYRTATAV